MNCKKHPIYCQIKKNKPKLNSKYAMTLSNHIYRASRKHGFPANIYTAILMQESGYRLGAKRTVKGHVKPPKDKIDQLLQLCQDFHYHNPGYDYVGCVNRINKAVVEGVVVTDYGIAQIYYKTVDSYEFDTEKLLTDLRYSIDAGAEVLGYFYKRYSKREYDWWVRYNIGTRKKHRVRTAWDEYKRLVSRYL